MSVLSDAIMQSVAFQMNPESKAVSAYLASSVQTMQLENEASKLDTISRIRKLIEEDNGGQPLPATVRDAYDRMLVRLTS